MDIAGVLTAGKFLSSALAQLGKPSHSKEAGESQALETASTLPGRADATAAFREILADYDVTRISPRRFSEMIRKLHDANLLSDQQFQELSLIRGDLDLDGVDSDESLNLVDFYLDKLRDLGLSPEDLGGAGGSLSASQVSQLAPLRHRLEWVEKLATVQSGTERDGLDALA
ncbi:MAG: hypothetical protein ABIP48_09025 [Planctomycetota bacterium]